MKDEQFKLAIQWLKSGGVIAYPTESVFGLGCDANNLKAIERILKIKHRDSSKGLILLVSDIRQASQFIQPLNNESVSKLNMTLDQATTWLLPKASQTSRLICGAHSKVAIRITKHPIARALCHQLGSPIVSTSCNLNGEPPYFQAGLIPAQLSTHLDLILAGDCGGQAPSMIVDFISGEQIR